MPHICNFQYEEFICFYFSKVILMFGFMLGSRIKKSGPKFRLFTFCFIAA
jgi:hypothetical protein